MVKGLENPSLPLMLELIAALVPIPGDAFLSSYTQGEVITLPIAHFDGNYFVPQDELEEMKKHHQILLQYVENINGSIERIAGICNKEKNVFGLMPHPERAIEVILGGVDGLSMLGALL